MKRTQFVIAVFDDWSAIASAVEELGTDRIGRLGALLHMRSDGPPVLAVSWLVQDMTELHFATSRKRVRCTTGKIAAQLATRSAGGAHDLAHALQGWVGPGHAKELQWHVESGRLVLLLQPARSEDFEGICSLMVQASPHLVELCDLEFNP